MWKTNAPIVAQSIFYGLRGSGSVSASIRYSTTTLDARGVDIEILPTIVTDTSSGHFVSAPLDNPSIASGSWVFLVISGTVVGSPTELNATLYYY